MPPPKLSEIDAGAFVTNKFSSNDWEMHPLFQQGQPVKKIKGRNPLLSSEPEWYSKALNTAVEVKRKDFIASLQSVDWGADHKAVGAAYSCHAARYEELDGV
ncbi:MAG: hypothetical protein IPP22_08110 [Nitrosomonas sp.]|nr:hypothetical protein [Nitrosomonas sp.]